MESGKYLDMLVIFENHIKRAENMKKEIDKLKSKPKQNGRNR